MSSSSASLDIESLLAREYRPTLVSQLLPREKFNPHEVKKTTTGGAPPKPSRHPIADESVRHLQQELIESLVKETPEYKSQVGSSGGDSSDGSSRGLADAAVQAQILASRKASHYTVDPKYCPVECTNWEDAVRWKLDKPKPHRDPMDYLAEPHNHHLDDPDLLANIPTKPSALKNIKVPLILEYGVAGRSVVSKFISHRPVAASKSNEYQNRRNGIVVMPVKDRETAKFEERQKRRDEMEHQKTKRVAEAMGDLGVVGKGRAITSSLMGECYEWRLSETKEFHARSRRHGTNRSPITIGWWNSGSRIH